MCGAGQGDPARAGPRSQPCPRGQGARAEEFPDAAPSARLATDLQRLAMNDGAQLVLVSNRGPASFTREENGEITATRGGGGLVTALTGLVHHRDALWISSAMGDEDTAVAREHDGKAFDLALDDGAYRIRLVESDPDAYDGFYNVVANPMLWFIQHYLWDLSNAPDIREHEVEAYEQVYRVVNDDLAGAVLEEIEGEKE